MSSIQSVVFDKKKFTTEKARKWLRKNNFIAIKRVDITTNKLRYRLKNPGQFKSFRTKKSDRAGISFVIGFKSV